MKNKTFSLDERDLDCEAAEVRLQQDERAKELFLNVLEKNPKCKVSPLRIPTQSPST